MNLAGQLRLTAALAGAGALLVAGCGGDESGDTSASTPAIPTVTSPIATTPTGTTAATTPAKKTKTSTTLPPSAGGCEIPDTYQKFKFTGVDCATAVGIAKAWDSSGDDCNTIDDPNSPEGFKRTCTVEDYECTAKRDVHSDARFVTCTMGGASVRFTWLPI